MRSLARQFLLGGNELEQTVRTPGLDAHGASRVPEQRLERQHALSLGQPLRGPHGGHPDQRVGVAKSAAQGVDPAQLRKAADEGLREAIRGQLLDEQALALLAGEAKVEETTDT